MTFNIGVTKEIDNFLDSVYVISHSSSTVRVYRLGINHFSKFIEKQYSCSIKEIIESIKNKSVDPYDVLKEYVVYLDRQGKKPATIKLMITAVKGFLRHCKIQIYSEEFQSNIEEYEKLAIEELKLEQITINNHKSTINGFLNHSHGIINKQTVKAYLDSNESVSWKSNQVKALRKYIRDYLKLGNWINQFTFAKTKTKLKKETPSNEQLAQFCSLLPYQIQMVFLVLLPSGLRIGEVLSLKLSNFDPDTNMMDASDIHKGKTKSSWISFITKQASEYLEGYFEQEIDYEAEDNPKMFSVSARSVQ